RGLSLSQQRAALEQAQRQEETGVPAMKGSTPSGSSVRGLSVAKEDRYRRHRDNADVTHLEGSSDSEVHLVSPGSG
ncbi:unnamed protein product, partial [Amoebophrya sp. A25]